MTQVSLGLSYDSSTSISKGGSVGGVVGGAVSITGGSVDSTIGGFSTGGSGGALLCASGRPTKALTTTTAAITPAASCIGFRFFFGGSAGTVLCRNSSGSGANSAASVGLYSADGRVISSGSIIICCVHPPA